MWHEGSLLQHAGFSLVVVCGFSLSSCGVQAREQVGSVVHGKQSLQLRHAGSVSSFANIFSHSEGCVFVLFMAFFAVQKL